VRAGEQSPASECSILFPVFANRLRRTGVLPCQPPWLFVSPRLEIVGRDVDSRVVVDDAQLYPVKPSAPPKQIPANPRVPEEGRNRPWTRTWCPELQVQRCDRMLQFNAAGCGTENLQLSGFNIQAQDSACSRSKRQWLEPVSTYAGSSMVSTALLSVTDRGDPGSSAVNVRVTERRSGIAGKASKEIRQQALPDRRRCVRAEVSELLWRARCQGRPVRVGRD